MTEKLMTFPKEKINIEQQRFEIYKKIIHLHNQYVRYMTSVSIPHRTNDVKKIVVEEEKVEEKVEKKETEIGTTTLTLPVIIDSNGDKTITLISSHNTEFSVVKDKDSNVKLILKKLPK